MEINHTDIERLSVRQLFESGSHYVIPIYQRKYEWGKTEIEQLLMDIKDYYLEEGDKNYYTGTLIVDLLDYEEKNKYETIDGQQRLTTFNLIVCALREMKFTTGFMEKAIISFESRPNADKTLDFIFRNGLKEPKFEDYNVEILNGLKVAYKTLVQLRKELKDDGFSEFVKYLFEKVILLRVRVPEDTDMNHYFEIMNSRGEQLEKHEILKARLMKEFNNEPNGMELRQRFHYIWEACSDMTVYIQLLFHKNVREQVFGVNWFNFSPETTEDLFNIDFGDLIRKEEDNKGSEGVEFGKIIATENIESLLKDLTDDAAINTSDADSFQPVINFENFLLHVLKIQLQSDEISLDDKRLLAFFETHLKKLSDQADRVEFVKGFIYGLLKIRFLLDQYILKRQYAGSENYWSLKCVKFYDRKEEGKKDSYSYVNSFENNSDEILQLLSMFHVSTPTLIYKYWLFGALNYLNNSLVFDNVSKTDEKPLQIIEKDYKDFLKKMAARFMTYRFLSGEKREYNDIILRPEKLEKKYKVDFETDVKFDDGRKKLKFEEKLEYSEIENNLVFNYLDYLLWRENPQNNKDFEFSFRSSVEHYYPQNPISGDRLEQKRNHEKLDLLNCFGNLCLITPGQNSRLNNHLPEAKKEYYKKGNIKESIKQQKMMEYDKWEEEEILIHQNKMIELLSENLFSS